MSLFTCHISYASHPVVVHKLRLLQKTQLWEHSNPCCTSIRQIIHRKLFKNISFTIWRYTVLACKLMQLANVAPYDSHFLDIWRLRDINSVVWSYNGLLTVLMNMYYLATWLTSYSNGLVSPSLHMLALAAPSAVFLLRGFIVFDKQLCGALAPPYGYLMTCKIILSATRPFIFTFR